MQWKADLIVRLDVDSSVRVTFQDSVLVSLDCNFCRRSVSFRVGQEKGRCNCTQGKGKSSGRSSTIPWWTRKCYPRSQGGDCWCPVTGTYNSSTREVALKMPGTPIQRGLAFNLSRPLPTSATVATCLAQHKKKCQ